jgi:DNA-binding NarL/FixJ family response regulator
MLLEDDTSVRQILAQVLLESGKYNVFEFGRGRDAIASFRRLRPLIALVDIGLPDISGIEVITQLAGQCPSVQILVLSTFGDSDTVVRAISAGASGYVLKGGAPEELLRDVMELENGGSPLSPSIARHLIAKLRRPMVANDAEALTSREDQVLQLLSRGLSYNEIGNVCGLAVGTVHSHVKSIYRKLAVHSKTEAVFEGRARGLITD